MPPLAANASLHEQFDHYARMSTKTGQTFDQMGGQNIIMDISEFNRWCQDSGLVPKYMSIEKMKTFFRESNLGQHADEFRNTFDFNEFVVCARRCVNEAVAVAGNTILPAKITFLKKLLAVESSNSSAMVVASLSTTVVQSPSQSNLLVALNNDQGEHATDGVRVPVSTLWSSVREVESHLQTELQLREALDRLAAQAKAEVAQLERQKAAAIAALEASEDQLLELEREANAQLDEMQSQRNVAQGEADALREELEEIKVGYEKKITTMREINVQAIEDKDSAEQRRDDMERLLASGNEERDHAYTDARALAKQRDDLSLQFKLAEADHHQEAAALERKMADACAELEKKVNVERVEAEIRLKKAEEKATADLADEKRQSSEALAAAETLRRKQAAEYQTTIHNNKAASDQALRDAADKFRDAEAEWTNAMRNLNMELESSKAAHKSTSAELARSQRALDDLKGRLTGDVQRLHSELQSEIERRELVTSDLDKLKQDYNSERLSLNSQIDTTARKLQAADLEVLNLKGEIDSINNDRTSLREQLGSTRGECDRLFLDLQSVKQELRNKESEYTSLENMHNGLKKDYASYAQSAERKEMQLRTSCKAETDAHEATKQQCNEQLQQIQLARDEIKKLTEQIQSERKKNLTEMESLRAETKRRLETFERERNAVEESLRAELKNTNSSLETVRDELSTLHEQFAVVKSREESLGKLKTVLEEKTTIQQRDIEKKAIQISDLERQVANMKQTIINMEEQRAAKAEQVQNEIQSIRDEHATKIKYMDDTARVAAEALRTEVTRTKDTLALVRSDLSTANVTIEELRNACNKLRSQLSGEEVSHSRTQEENEKYHWNLNTLQQELAASKETISEMRYQRSKLEEEKLQLEADLRILALNKEQLEADLDRSTAEERRLNGALSDEKNYSQTIMQRKEHVDKKLGQTEAVVDTLRVELDSLHMTNDQLAQEARREIIGLKQEMSTMRSDYDKEIQRLHEKLRQLQADRDQIESAYQFARDELAVIRATLAEMEEGQHRTQYIVEDHGNPTLVNRMKNEWNRVDGNPVGPGPNDGSVSPRRSTFSREFRRVQGVTYEEPKKQGSLGHTPWRS